MAQIAPTWENIEKLVGLYYKTLQARGRVGEIQTYDDPKLIAQDLRDDLSFLFLGEEDRES